MITKRASIMFRMFLGIGFLLLVSTVVESVVTFGQPGALSTCYSIPESRARLAAKDKLDALDLNFTEIGLNYIELYQELEMISMKSVEYCIKMKSMWNLIVP